MICVVEALAEVLKIKLVEPHQLTLFKQPLAQIEQALTEPNQPPVKLYYVHYIDYNKRLDEWVTIDRMRLDKIQAPVASSGGASLANSHSAQSHLCNISNSNLKELTGPGHKHDLSSDEHNVVPPKKKKSSNKQTPAASHVTQLASSLHGSVSVPVNLASTGRLVSQGSSINEITVMDHTPSTPSSALNEANEAIHGFLTVLFEILLFI